MSGKVDVIILAGGLGTRLRETVPDLPKVLAPVGDKPFLDVIFGYLGKCDFIGTVVLAVGYMAEKVIREYSLRNEFRFPIVFSIEEELLGTGGAIKQALAQTGTEDVLVINGDSYIAIDLSGLVADHMRSRADMTMVLKEVENTDRYGLVKMDEDRRIRDFAPRGEVGSRGYINAGMYLMRRTLFANVEEGKVISLEKELFPVFVKEHVFGYSCEGAFIDIGVPGSYRSAASFLECH